MYFDLQKAFDTADLETPLFILTACHIYEHWSILPSIVNWFVA